MGSGIHIGFAVWGVILDWSFLDILILQFGFTAAEVVPYVLYLRLTKTLPGAIAIGLPMVGASAWLYMFLFTSDSSTAGIAIYPAVSFLYGFLFLGLLVERIALWVMRKEEHKQAPIDAGNSNTAE